MIPSNQKNPPASPCSNPRRSARFPFLIGLVAASVASGGALLRHLPRGGAPTTVIESEFAPSKSRPNPIQSDALNQQPPPGAHASAAGTQAPGVTIPAPGTGPTQLQQPSDQTRQLVNALVQPDTALTQEQAVQWKRNLEQLIQEGTAALPAMREFLARNVDLDFGPEGRQRLGYSSVRTAMIDALPQIGGPEAVSLMLQTLQTTSDPREIALLAQSLDKQAPEQYRAEAINATRETLALAAQGKLDGRDVGPLFEVLQKFAGAAAVPDLEQASGQWKYYAALSLAQLAEGAGIPALIQMARDPAAAGKGTLSVALEMLARVAPQYPEARSALIEQARQNMIPPSLWPYVASSLSGEQYQYRESVFSASTGTPSDGNLKTIHINFGNQNLYSAAGVGGLSPDQVNQQVSLIDELLAATNDPAAAILLRQSRELLLKRSGHVAEVTSPGR